MRCLTDVELQALADGEAGAAERAHAAACERCTTRLEARQAEMATLATLAVGDAPPSLEGKVRRAMTAAPVRGATALRPGARPLRPLWASVIGVAAVAALVMFVVLPRVDSPTTLSAAQVISRSLEQMTTGSGVELLEYELVLTSTLRQHRDLPAGPLRVVQLFDRGNPGRYLFLQHAADGTLHAAAAQDPATGRRTELMRVDGVNYIVHVTSPDPLPSIPEILQSQGESVLRTMQLAGDQHLSIVDGPDGREYVIELPRVTAASGAVPLDLHAARVAIDGRDFRVREFTASGVLFKQPFDVSFKLIQQLKAASVDAAAWQIPQGPDDVVIEGDGAGRLDDVLAVVLREVGRNRGR